MPVSVQVENLRCVYEDVALFKQVSFDLQAGASMIIAGRTGSGKSALLEICAGIRAPANGVVRWNGRDIASIPRRALMNERARIGYVFQTHGLISNKSVFENVALPLRYHTTGSNDEIDAKVMRLLNEFSLVGVARLLPEALSIGQARCVAMARALVMEPDMLFLDEPTGGMDPITADGIINMLGELRRSRPVTLLVVTHKVQVIARLASPVAVLEGGTLIMLDAISSDEKAKSRYIALLRGDGRP